MLNFNVELKWVGIQGGKEATGLGLFYSVSSLLHFEPFFSKYNLEPGVAEKKVIIHGFTLFLSSELFMQKNWEKWVLRGQVFPWSGRVDYRFVGIKRGGLLAKRAEGPFECNKLLLFAWQIVWPLPRRSPNLWQVPFIGCLLQALRYFASLWSPIRIQYAQLWQAAMLHRRGGSQWPSHLEGVQDARSKANLSHSRFHRKRRHCHRLILWMAEESAACRIGAHDKKMGTQVPRRHQRFAREEWYFPGKGTGGNVRGYTQWKENGFYCPRGNTR